jgi:peptidylglycine monooxygenase
MERLSALILLVACFYGTHAIGEESTELRMPGAIVTKPETYLCTAIEVDQAKPHYITEFKAHGKSQHAHHILLFGCTTPGSDHAIWNCGEMNNGGKDHIYESASPCGSGSQILYDWGRDAPALKLPEGVGFKVGGDSQFQYLVAQVHYMHPMEGDDSGVDLKSTTEIQPRLAATMLLATDGIMQAKSTENFETACMIDEDLELHPFAFRTHSHDHGKVVSGWKVTQNEDGKDTWELIGKHDPLKPQMFYPVADEDMTIKLGDIVAARCRMENDGHEAVSIGSTGHDEMCNFYMMYWVDGDETLKDNTCVSPGPPDYYWTNEGGLNNIPDKEANTL